jgi:riboflavin transporter
MGSDTGQEARPQVATGASKYVIMWLRIFFGAHLLYSSLRYFLNFEAVGPIPHPVAGPFVESLTETGIYHLVKTIELVTGAAIFLNLFVPLCLVIEFPISIVIFILNFTIVASGRQLFSGPQEVVLNGLLLICYGRYSAPLLRPIAPAMPAWRITRADIFGR